MLYDRVYRFWRSLDTPGADLPPVLRIEIRRSFRTVRLSDGAVVRRGDCIGALHLNNERIAALHGNGLSPLAIGLEVRRDMVASLHLLATLMAPGDRLADLRAVAAVTIFHHGLRRLGFEIDPRGLMTPGATTAYQRALLASLHPSGRLRILGMTAARAERLWISREKLRALYAPVVHRASKLSRLIAWLLRSDALRDQPEALEPWPHVVPHRLGFSAVFQWEGMTSALPVCPGQRVPFQKPGLCPRRYVVGSASPEN